MRSLTLAVLLSSLAAGAAPPNWKMFLVAGQSNAMGITGDQSMTGSVKCDTLTAYEYDYTNNRLSHLKDPVGLPGLGFDRAIYGSAWPALAKRYHGLTGDTVIIVQAAKNASSILQESDIIAGANWSPTGQLFANAVTKINRAVTLTQVPLGGVVWLQGETDAIVINNGTITKAQYKAGLVSLIARFRTTYGATLPFYIIRIGTDYTREDAGFQQVRDAEEEVATEDSFTVVVYRSTVNFQALGWMNDGIHYNQTGLNRAGEGSADTIVLFENRQATRARHGFRRSPEAISLTRSDLFDIRGRSAQGRRIEGVAVIRRGDASQVWPTLPGGGAAGNLSTH